MKYAAHFWLRPDGSIGKYPVLTFDKDGILVETRERDVFVEEAGMEMHNGLFIPGVVDIMPISLSKLSMEKIEDYIKNQYINLTSVLGVPFSVIKKIDSSYYPKMKFVGYSRLIREGEVTNRFSSAFEKMKKENVGLDGVMSYLKVNAMLLGKEDLYGSLKEGTSPGLIALSNIDYTNIRITKLTKIKKIE